MSDEPVPWSKDPSFEAEFGCKLGDVRELHRDYDLDAIRARALEPSSAGPPPAVPRGLGRIVGGGGAVAVVLAALLGGWWLSAPDDSPPAPPARAERAPAPAPTPLAPAASPPEPLPVVAPRPAPAKVVPIEPVPIPVVVAPPPAEAPSAGPSAATWLQAENEAFRAAQEALVAGDAAEALRQFDAYLQAWPDAHLRDEADLGRLEALVGLARWPEAEASAAVLATRPSLAEKRPHVLAFRAQALAGLGRCREAVDVAAEVSRQHAAAARRSCVAP